MGNVERCDKTLPTNEMMFYVRRDPALRARWLTDLRGIATEFGLSRAEYEAIRDRDPKRLMDLGGHQYYDPQILRRFFGAAQNTNASAALECYKRAFPEETARAMALEARLEGTQAMARIVAAMAMTHSPGLTGWFTRAPEAHQQPALGATAERRRPLEA